MGSLRGAFDKGDVVEVCLCGSAGEVQVRREPAGGASGGPMSGSPSRRLRPLIGSEGRATENLEKSGSHPAAAKGLKDCQNCCDNKSRSCVQRLSQLRETAGSRASRASLGLSDLFLSVLLSQG